ncbi:hypothetical protein, conserved [Leishmania tarentolae]|uniref:Uncharacterized protein n=1 Tax=Leishmania tarentolae TaxID=5689 RepID=A0A640KEC3_LEITA|nr:hypothetical protein, conserved [Leishmania tarentolae]GET88046.1 hypothetical protein, conserved [Leishmania tarentolae]
MAMRRATGTLSRGGVFSETHASAFIGPSLPFACFLLQTRRPLHMPPGGFDEALPESFGRQSGKGELSNVNLHTKRQNARRIAKNRRKLRLPPTSSPPLTLARVKGELLHLTQQTRKARKDVLSRSDEAVSMGATDSVSSPSASRISPTEVANSICQDEERADRLTPCSPRTARCVRETSNSSAAMSAASSSSPASSLTVKSPPEEAWTSHEDAVERFYAIKPASTIFGSDLDRLERDMMRDYHQRGARLPPRDRVYAEFGSSQRGRRMQWEPSSSFDCLAPSDFRFSARSETTVGDGTNRNLAAYHLYAEAYQTQQEESWRSQRDRATKCKGISLCRADQGPSVGAEADLPASENPHFPTGNYSDVNQSRASSSEHVGEACEALLCGASSAPKEVVVNARTDYKARLSIVSSPPGEGEDTNRIVYDAYNQRPTDNALLEVRGADYWGHYENRRRVEERSAYRLEAIARETLQEGAVDTSEVEYSTNRVRRETLLYFQAHPINEMIQEPFVRIRQFVPPGGGASVSFHPDGPLPMPADSYSDSRSVIEWVNMDADIPVQEARRMAQELGLDLIRIGALYSQKTDRRIIALCMVGDHREHMREMIKFKIQKLGVQPPPTKECIEVPFKGGTHPHAIRFKCVGVAKHLLHRHAIRINLTKFGTPREGFPVFQSILDELKRQCMRLKAYHTAGQIQSNYDEIFCYLYPSTGRSPKTTVTHPTPKQVLAARDERILENEKEIYFDDLQDKATRKQRLQYMLKLENGTAWAEKDEGMSLQRQRAIKVMLGYLPKGNRELYAARGDVNIPAPFRASHPTSVHKWSYPSESNLEQASRGAAALGKRAAMPISEMHDAGETPENPTQLDRFYYTAEGPALEMGEFKEALGLKDNRARRPPMGAGFATLGVESVDEAMQKGFATK